MKAVVHLKIDLMLTMPEDRLQYFEKNVIEEVAKRCFKDYEIGIKGVSVADVELIDRDINAQSLMENRGVSLHRVPSPDPTNEMKGDLLFP